LPYLHQVDASVFKVSKSLGRVLAEHYATDFGFLICKLTTSGEQHPIAYTHPVANDGRLFVPTRHEHGHTHAAGSGSAADDDGHADWDHFIYSNRTTDAAAGHTSAEMHKANKRLVPGSLTGLTALRAFPVELPRGGPLRCLRITSEQKTWKPANGDLYFAYNDAFVGHNDDDDARWTMKESAAMLKCHIVPPVHEN
jgi:hypothetical protein